MFQKLLLMAVFSMYFLNSQSQNVGIGTANPQNKLQVNGNLLITAPTTATNTAATAAQVKNMTNGGTINFPAADSTGRIYDPGGPAGNYTANQTATADINEVSNAIGFEVSIESIDLSSADSLIFKDYYNGTTLLAVGNLYFTTGKWTFNASRLQVIFKSNPDANVGAGFSLLFRRLYYDATSPEQLRDFTRYGLAFDAKNGAFRSGEINNEEPGPSSFATGLSAVASGEYSAALGSRSKASGFASFAAGSNADASGARSIAIGNAASNFIVGAKASGPLAIAIGSSPHASGNYAIAVGHTSNASGHYSTAFGFSANATGYISTAIGNGSTASGERSLAMGSNTMASGQYANSLGSFTTASGNYSTSMGSYVSTNNYTGAFIIGDASTNDILNIATSNSFRARFDGGYRFFTSAAAINAESCQLPAGGNAWVTASDYRLKEKFLVSDGESFLQKIAGMQLGSWNYISQNPNRQRHYGPMAQDFYAAFGKDDFGTIGNDTTINAADFDGVNLIAIQALEKRTQKIVELEKDNETLKAMIMQLRKEMDEMKKKK